MIDQINDIVANLIGILIIAGMVIPIITVLILGIKASIETLVEEFKE